MENAALLARINEQSLRLDLIQAQVEELFQRMDSVPRLAELLVKHEDQLRKQEEGEDLVG